MADRALQVVRASRPEPPRDHRLEASILGAAMLDDVALASLEASLVPADFHSTAHATVFAAMQVLSAASKPVDETTLEAQLDAMGQLEAVGGRGLLGAIAAACGGVKNLDAHIAKLVEMSTMRKIFDAAVQIANAACDKSLTVDACTDRSMTALYAATERAHGGPVQIADALDASMTEAAGNVDEQSRTRGEPTGIRSIDAVVAGRGLRPGRLYVLGAPPGTGKSALLTNILRNMAGRGLQCLMFSMEMSKREFADRLLCMEARVSSERFEAGQLTGEDFAALTPAAQRLFNLPLFIDDAKEQTITSLRAKAKRHKRRHGLAVVAVDFIQLVKVTRAEDDRQRITDVVNGLCSLADELQVPVIAITSMNRAYANRPDKRPVVSDMLGSSHIESAAALVAFLYRDELYNEETEDRGIAEFIIRKQRHGKWPLTVRLKFDGPAMRFDDIDVHHDTSRGSLPDGYDMDAAAKWDRGE